MALVKCPRCELNYIREGERFCEICKKELRGEDDSEETPEMCSECNEHPAIKSEDLCLFCLREKKRQESIDKKDEDIPAEDGGISEIPDAVELDEIDIASNDIPPPERDEIDKELGIDDENAEEECTEDYEKKRPCGEYDDEEEDDEYV
ncbi:MAG: hypothetical protein Q8O09_02550 [Bacillota bacterium]|nr:hypothetical protein [Bacillota bacterium]